MPSTYCLNCSEPCSVPARYLENALCKGCIGKSGKGVGKYGKGGKGGKGGQQGGMVINYISLSVPPSINHIVFLWIIYRWYEEMVVDTTKTTMLP